MRRFVVFAAAILIFSTCTLASDFSSLPPEAQAGVRAALRKYIPVQDFTLTASDGLNYADFGASVAIDGNIVVVGATQVLTNENGAVYVFVKPPNGWENMIQTAKLTASDGQVYDGLGCSVGISGNTVVAGACNATVNGNELQGAAYVFVEPAGGWRNMTETAKLTASDGASDAYFGSAVSIRGGTIAVGAPFDTIENPSPGEAYVFVEPSGGWTGMTQTAELIASNRMDYDRFGVSVSVSSSTVVVGGGFCASCIGVGYVFVEPRNGWSNMSETAQLTASDGRPDGGFGISVSISGDTIAVGGSGQEGETGAVYIFVRPTQGWTNMTQNAELTVGNTKYGCLGDPVSISGRIVLAGDVCTHGYVGVAYVFVKPVGGWQNTSKYTVRLSAPFGQNNDYFAGSVAFSDTTAVIGMPESGGLGPGEAFIFTAQ